MVRWLALLVLAAASPVRADAAPAADCDRLAAHPDDPDRAAPGVAQADVDTAAAIAACTAAVAADPANGRLNYQLARALGYAGRGAEAGPYRAAAVAAEHRQALFVVGYLHLLGLNGAPRDVCLAGDLIRRSALAGRQAGLIGFPHWALAGRFAGCAVPLDRAELRRFLDQALTAARGNFYQQVAVEALLARLAADGPAVPPGA